MTGETVDGAEASLTRRGPVRRPKSQRWIWISLSLVAALLLGGGIALPLVLHQSDAREYAGVFAEASSAREQLIEAEPRAESAELVARARVEAASGAADALENIAEAGDPILAPEIASTLEEPANALREQLAETLPEPEAELADAYEAALVAEESPLPTSPFELEIDDVIEALDIGSASQSLPRVPDAEIGAQAIADAREQSAEDRASLERATERLTSATAVGDGVRDALADALPPLREAAESIPEQSATLGFEYPQAQEELVLVAEAAARVEQLLAEQAEMSDADRVLRIAAGVSAYVDAADAAREVQDELDETSGPEADPSPSGPEAEPSPSGPAASPEVPEGSETPVDEGGAGSGSAGSDEPAAGSAGEAAGNEGEAAAG